MAISGELISGRQPQSYGLKAAMSSYCKNSLLEVIELQIIPRLVDSHPALGPIKVQQPSGEFTPDSLEVISFSNLCIQAQPQLAMQRIELWVQQGYAIDEILLKLIAPVARHLGWMWEQDEVDFSQVSLGLIRLQQIIHLLGYTYQRGPQSAGAVRRMMIGSAPGSQHLLGLSMVAEFFRQDGWEVVVEIADSQSGLLQAIGNEWFDLVGLSVGLTGQLPMLPGLIAQLKAASRNAAVPVVLGGAAFFGGDVQNPDLGADGISTDAADAVMLGNLLVARPVANPLKDSCSS
jgi:methanogenic corrinoid protein MtbC1